MSKIKRYAGIGSRETPDDVLQVMTDYAKVLGRNGWILRSGGAIGADSAFEKGCDEVNGKKEIFYAEDCTEEARAIFARCYPNVKGKSKYVMDLLGRNFNIIYGTHLMSAVDMMVCWTPEGKDVGGTAIGLTEARVSKIRVINLGIPGNLHRLKIALYEGLIYLEARK